MESNNLAARMKKAEADIIELKAAFPNGDVAGHCRYHEVMIQKLEETRRLRVAIQEKTISGLIWAAILAGGTAIWHAVKDALK